MVQALEAEEPMEASQVTVVLEITVVQAERQVQVLHSQDSPHHLLDQESHQVVRDQHITHQELQLAEMQVRQVRTARQS